MPERPIRRQSALDDRRFVSRRCRQMLEKGLPPLRLLNLATLYGAVLGLAGQVDEDKDRDDQIPAKVKLQEDGRDHDYLRYSDGPVGGPEIRQAHREDGAQDPTPIHRKGRKEVEEAHPK